MEIGPARRRQVSQTEPSDWLGEYRAQQERHREQAGRPDQRDDVDRVAVDESDHDEREQVVRDD